jgi:hypothetical protein
MHRSFVGSPSLCEGLHFLRMTALSYTFVILPAGFCVHPSQTTFPTAVILRAVFRPAKRDESKRRTYAFLATLLLRLHHDESLEDLIHGRDRAPGATGARTQARMKGEFAARYKIDRLVYFERFGDIHAAIGREKQIKGLLRIKKIALIVSMNPAWRDLSAEWYVRHRYQPEIA